MVSLRARATSLFSALLGSGQSTDAFTLRSTLALISAIALAIAIQLSSGLHPDSFNITLGALLVTLVAVVLPERELPARAGVGASLAFVIALTVFFVIRFRTWPGVYLSESASFAWYSVFLGFAAVSCAALLINPRSQTFLGLMLGMGFGLGVWLLRSSPAPHIDVWAWHNSAYEALAQGTDPYAITMPNLYGHTKFFAPGLADETHVFVGYPYPPVTLLAGAVGQLLAGDYRYWNLLAQVCAAGFIARIRPGRMAALAAIVFLFQPRSLFVLEQGWTEATSVLALTCCVWCAVNQPRALPWVFGVMLGVKQYFVFAVPLLPLLLDTKDPRVLVKFLLTAAIIPVMLTVPFILWDPHPFFDSVVAFQAKQPFRPEALSVMAWLVQRGGPMLPLNLCFVLAAGAVVLSLWRSTRSPAAFSTAFALALLFFFFFAKQAFTNYYYLIIASLCTAAAAGFSPGFSANAAEPRADT